ncbi:unnamed protein product [Diamesa serratosioi]
MELIVAARLSSDDISEILNGSLNKDAKYLSHRILRLSEKPIGYLGDHYLLLILLELNGLKEEKDFFLKIIPKHVEKRMEYLSETRMFQKEIGLYQTLLPRLLSLGSIKWAPRCFFARDDDFIVLENLKDYAVIASKDLVFNKDQIILAASTLGIFHASSVVLEEQTKMKIVDLYPEELIENAYPRDENNIRRRGLENAIEVLKELIKRIPKYQNAANLKVILENFGKCVRRIYDFAEPSKKYRNVVNHGDLWLNNFMFKELDGKVTSCKFVDFQLARYCPPAMDLCSLIIINSFKELREKYIIEIIDSYYESFQIELKNKGINSNILTKSEITSSYKEYQLAGLIEAALFGHVVLLPSDLSTNILNSSEDYDNFINKSRVDVCLNAFENDIHFRQRLTEILTEIVDFFI